MANKSTSQWASYDDNIKKFLTENESLSDIQVARLVIGQEDKYQVELLRTYVRRNRKRILDVYEGITKFPML